MRGPVLDPDRDLRDGVRRLGVLHLRDHSHLERDPGPDQPADHTVLVAELLGLRPALDLEVPVRGLGGHLDRELMLARLVPRDVRRVADVQRPRGFVAVPDPALDRALLHLEEPHGDPHRRGPAVDEHLAAVEGAFAGVEGDDVLGHQHAPLPAHLVLRGGGAVGVQHVALVEHRVGQAAGAREAVGCRAHSPASSSSAAIVSSQPTSPRRPGRRPAVRRTGDRDAARPAPGSARPSPRARPTPASARPSPCARAPASRRWSPAGR